MPDLEKVLKGLECCTTPRKCDDGCPYNLEDICLSDDMKRDAIALLKRQKWHLYEALEWEARDEEGLKDHYFYLVTTKDRGTPMKAMYHIDDPIGFRPVDGYFNRDLITAWMELPENYDGEVIT